MYAFVCTALLVRFSGRAYSTTQCMLHFELIVRLWWLCRFFCVDSCCHIDCVVLEVLCSWQTTERNFANILACCY